MSAQLGARTWSSQLLPGAACQSELAAHFRTPLRQADMVGGKRAPQSQGNGPTSTQA
jgi:hypothetical protein